MIKRNSSKIVDSLVNSSHEEHFNISKAIRDDAPITSTNSVIKSINFESDKDGAYILRKPLIKKLDLNKTNQILLSNKTDILTFENNTITITNASTIILKFYDSTLKVHTIPFPNSLKTMDWITIVDSYNLPEFTLLNVKIDHTKFAINLYTQGRWFPGDRFTLRSSSINTDVPVDPTPEDPAVPQYMPPDYILVQDTWTDTEGFEHNNSIGNILKRFVKVYPHESEENTYIFEIVHPEFNSITSNMDVGNTSTLDINLLLDNPYAIRDLYNYGYVSTTKILPYVSIDDTITVDDVNSKTIWELTEKGPFANNTKGFKILTSTNPTIFNKNILILKAFLTTKATPNPYYCCWEYSENDGVDWKICQEFKMKFKDKLEEINVSDLTSADFEDTVYKDSLTRAASYLVTKQVVRMDLFNDYSFMDSIQNRPDVLVLYNPNLHYKYRFQIYIDTQKEIPVPEDVQGTATVYNFNDISTEVSFSESGDAQKFKYEFSQGNSDTAPSVEDSSVLMYAGSAYTSDSNSVLKQHYGNVLTVRSTDPNFKIKSVTITLAYKKYDETNHYYKYLGGIIGSINKDKNDIPEPDENDKNPYNMTVIAKISTEGSTGYTTPYVMLYGCNNLWVNQSSSKTATVSISAEPDSGGVISFVNLSSCLYEYTAKLMLQDDTVLPVQYKTIKVKSISVSYTTTPEVLITSTYLASTTGTFSISYSDTTQLVEDLTLERDRLFKSKLYYNEKQAQLMLYNNTNVYVSNIGSTIIKLMNTISIPETITKIISWRNYLILFTAKTIYLASYDSANDTFNLKTLSNSVGVPKEDANTIVPILNSIYFKSGSKIYKLVPNLYASSDDILNIHQVSTGINSILENIVNTYIENNNFSYADADTYSIFIPINETLTYCINFDFNSQLWTVQTYPTLLVNVEQVSASEVYVYDANTWYYFKENLSVLLKQGLNDYCLDENEDVEDYSFNIFLNSIPYADYLTRTPKELISDVLMHNSSNYNEYFTGISTPIEFLIDFGQKSTNYTIDKQFLETKIILATLSAKDTFPLTLDIYTDGVARELHWDATTDSSLWKTSLNDVGILNTNFYPNDTDFNGIFRQLIVKYSGRGKSIRHVISGSSQSLFKFYSMDVRARILPKKH